ncbi:hypothetical protein L0F63_004241 [Massospora cicadina]|nr:hypothetical protein L0F63_004241 [Massospora cicadina]
MPLLADLDRALTLSREMIEKTRGCRLYRDLAEKLSRKVKRAVDILVELKATQVGPEKGLSSKRLHPVVKNYLSVAGTGWRLLDGLEVKSSLSAYFNSDSHRKDLYHLLTHIEQAVYELDTAARLHERLAFERFKAAVTITQGLEAEPSVSEGSGLDLVSNGVLILRQNPEEAPVLTNSVASDTSTSTKVVGMELQSFDQLNEASPGGCNPTRPTLESAAQLNQLIRDYSIPPTQRHIPISTASPKKHVIRFTPHIKDLVEEKTYRLDNPELLALFLREVTNLTHLQGSPYIVRFYGLTQSVDVSRDYMLYSSLLETTLKGSVYEVVQTQPLSFGRTLGVMEDVAHGLVYLHDTHGFTHGNLNASNVLVTAADRAKITGLEFASSISDAADRPSPLATLFPHGLDHATSNCGFKVNWLDPTLALNPNQKSSPENDIHGYGLLFWFMFSHTVPFKSLTCTEILHTLRQGGKEDITKVPYHYRHLLQRCWDLNLTARPKAKQLLGLLSEPVHQPQTFHQLQLQPGLPFRELSPPTQHEFQAYASKLPTPVTHPTPFTTP